MSFYRCIGAMVWIMAMLLLVGGSDVFAQPGEESSSSGSSSSSSGSTWTVISYSSSVRPSSSSATPSSSAAATVVSSLSSSGGTSSSSSSSSGAGSPSSSSGSSLSSSTGSWNGTLVNATYSGIPPCPPNMTLAVYLIESTPVVNDTRPFLLNCTFNYGAGTMEPQDGSSALDLGDKLQIGFGMSFVGILFLCWLCAFYNGWRRLQVIQRLRHERQAALAAAAGKKGDQQRQHDKRKKQLQHIYDFHEEEDGAQSGYMKTHINRLLV